MCFVFFLLFCFVRFGRKQVFCEWKKNKNEMYTESVKVILTSRRKENVPNKKFVKVYMNRNLLKI